MAYQSDTAEWFAIPDEESGKTGLSFECTMCGRCCTGPEGYVLFTDDEARALATRLGVSLDVFIERYTHETSLGRSLNETQTEHGHDCVFLDRTSVPGRAVCGVYEDRPMQCRTWPFWKSIVKSPQAWARASAICPGIGRGTRYSVQEIRVLRDRVEM